MYTTLREKKISEELFQASRTSKEAGIAILISDKRDQTKASQKRWGGSFPTH